MGTISQLHDRLRPAADRIESEEAAVAAARRLAADFKRQSSERDINRILPFPELDALSLSGLTGITVPPEYEGLDVSNALLAEIVAIIAEGDASIGECLAIHFSALEGLRLHGGEDLQRLLFARALSGDRFAAASFPADSITAFALGHRIEGRSAQAPGLLFADWLVISGAPDNQLLYVSRRSEGLQSVDSWDGFGQRTNGTAVLVAENVQARADAAARQGAPAAAITALLNAGVDLGIARAVLSELQETSAVPAAAGPLIVGIEAAAALLERAGHRLDIAQINAGPAIADAEFSATAAQAHASELALRTATAIFEIAKGDTGGIGLNLDRHWRNARIRALGGKLERLHAKAAAHYSHSWEI